MIIEIVHPVRTSNPVAQLLVVGMIATIRSDSYRHAGIIVPPNARPWPVRRRHSITP